MILSQENNTVFINEKALHDEEEVISNLLKEFDKAKAEFIETFPLEFDKGFANNLINDITNDREWLLRIIVARKFVIDQSLKLLMEQIYWRTKWQPTEIKSNQVKLPLESGAWRLCGFTRNGTPLCNYKLNYWRPDDYDIEMFTRYVAFMLELITSQFTDSDGSPNKFICIFDLEGFSTSLIRYHVREMVSKLIYVAQSQYPERLKSLIFLNVPWGFSTAWTLIKPLLDEKTASKVWFLNPDLEGGYASELDKEADICPTVLSVSYGGQHEEYEIPS